MLSSSLNEDKRLAEIFDEKKTRYLDVKKTNLTQVRSLIG